MAKGSSLALKLLQWFVRGVQFCCAAIVLGIFAYFLATLHNHDMHISTWIRAVTGISGIAVIYTALGLLLLCCLAGHPFTSLVAIILDICFIGAFIYVAWANRAGASSCKGQVNTVFGSGDSNQQVTDDGHGGFTKLPKLKTACRLETAAMAVSIVAVLFFLFSLLVEFLLIRNRRKERRFGPSPANNYTSGSKKKRGGFCGLGGRKQPDPIEPSRQDPNALPAHTGPGEVRDSYATEQTRVGHSRGTDTAGTHDKFNKYGESGYDHPGYNQPGYNQPAEGIVGNGYHQPAEVPGDGYLANNPTMPAQNVAPAQYPTGNYQYGDGVYNTARGV